ncbi:hypothetical protein LHK94_00720 [Dickeya zeae]|uniref:hypothetical protein n=1 Tax=Dickeya zeae TaxID=204042 RepID=UPI001CFBA307|nr:hypothetical protein [Dickeya zeae]UCZ75583.1 hypothetical protein LHK94_00720 [Dickeya zeae]
MIRLLVVSLSRASSMGQGRDVGLFTVGNPVARKPNKWWVGEYAVFGNNSRQGRGW